MNSFQRRVVNELRYFKADNKDDSVRIELVGDNFNHLKGYIKGVEGTPYAGGTFELDIILNNFYPIRPPVIKFVTKIWHPAVNPFDGSICLQEKDDDVWPVCMTIHKTLLTIQSWMSCVNSKEPIDIEILHQANNNTEVFNKTAEFWTIRFAGARKRFDPDYAWKLEKMRKVSPDINFALAALSYHNWILPSDIEEATEKMHRQVFNNFFGRE